MDRPWFLDILGLPVHADSTAVRRAYAASLRGIDPGTDPDAFARLRAAYEAARSWCEREQEDVQSVREAHTPTVVAIRKNENGTAPATSPDAEALPDVAHDQARMLVDAFLGSLAGAPPERATERLVSTVAALRTQYIDAPGEFEEQLIDLLAQEALPHRVSLFESATTLFHWEEIGHLAQLGPRGQWVERVFSERLAWSRLATTRQAEWAHCLTRADTALSDASIRRWPEIATLLAHYPAWIRLHVSTAVLENWRTRFGTLDRHERENAVRSAPGAAAFRAVPAKPVPTKPSSRSALLTMLTLLLVLMMLVRAFVTWFGNGSSQPALPVDNAMPAMSVPGNPDRQRCAEVYDRLVTSADTTKRSYLQQQRLSDEALACSRHGLWHSVNVPASASTR